eukprot:9227105-Alexandrium_andersonii.AAC.1
MQGSAGGKRRGGEGRQAGLRQAHRGGAERNGRGAKEGGCSGTLRGRGRRERGAAETHTLRPPQRGRRGGRPGDRRRGPRNRTVDGTAERNRGRDRGTGPRNGTA